MDLWDCGLSTGSGLLWAGLEDNVMSSDSSTRSVF